MLDSFISLPRFLIEEQRRNASFTPDLRLSVEVVTRTCKAIAHAINKGALGQVLDSSESKNTHGEIQKKLDLMANEALVEANEWGGHLSAIASEEMEEVRIMPLYGAPGKYLLLFDPLDGSSNIDVNVSIGTIFSVLRRPNAWGETKESDFLQQGRKQLVAGYCLYGPQTTLTLTLGTGVHIFTLDREIGSFVLTQSHIKIPVKTQEFAINMSNMRHWAKPVKRYIDECLAGEDGERKQNFNMRWIASMVADVHRILTRGGVFLYPWDAREPDRAGKLRLMYEANPMAFIVEQAGGAATNGLQAIMDIEPKQLHERVAVILGSKEEVERITRYHREMQVSN